MLAAILGQPGAVSGAVSSLNRFLRQVLELACAVGGSLSPVRARTEGLTEPMLRGAVRELGRWGLGFGGEEGSLLVPVEVRTMFRNPGGLQSPITTLAESLTVQDLRRILTAHGVATRDHPTRKADIIALLSGLLGDPVQVQALLGAAPEPARAALAEVRVAGGSTRELFGSEHWGRGVGWYGWQRRADEDTGPGWLLRRGLVLPTDSGLYTFAVPAEVELALRGRLFPEWEAEPPPVTARPLREERHPLELVSAMGSLLQVWSDGVPALAAGGTPVRDLRRLARALRIEEEEAWHLVELAFRAGLLRERETVPERRSRARRNPRVIQSRRGVIEPTDTSRRWLEMPEAARWLDLYRAWVGTPVGPAGADPRWLARRTLLEVLEELPAGTGAPPQDLAQVLAWRRPSLFRGPDAARRLVEQVGAGLRLLGAGSAGPVVGLSDAGRLAQRPDLGMAQLEAVFPPRVSECTVTADHRIVVTGTPDPSLGTLLARVAEVTSIQPARVYRLTEASLARGLNDGVTARDILDTISSRARGGVPPNVVTLIEDVVRRHGRLRVGSGGVYVASEDPALLAAFANGRVGRSLRARRIAPDVVVLEGTTPAEAVAAMRRGGLMPVLDGQARPDPAPGRSPAPGPRTAGAGWEEVGMSAADAGALAATLRRSPTGERAMSEAEVARLAADASHRGVPVEVLVEGPEGNRHLHLHHVQLRARRLAGMEPFTFAYRDLNLGEVTWLRHAPEIAPLLPFGHPGEESDDDWEDEEDDWDEVP